MPLIPLIPTANIARFNFLNSWFIFPARNFYVLWIRNYFYDRQLIQSEAIFFDQNILFSDQNSANVVIGECMIRGDFGIFCLVLARPSGELKLSRRCLTCFCLSPLWAANCYRNKIFADKNFGQKRDILVKKEIFWSKKQLCP